MSTSPNPYQSPTTVAMHPTAVQWLAVPSVSLARVARGLGIMYTGIVLILLAFVLLYGLAFVPASPDAKLLMLKADGVMLLVGVLMEIVGPLFCLATPQETGAATFIYISAAAMIASLALQAASFLHVMGKIGELPPALSIAQLVLGAVSILAFMLFLRRLNTFIGRRDLARKSTIVFVLALVLITVQAGCLTYAFQPGSMKIELNILSWGGLAMAIAGIVTFVMYANLLTYTRQAILRGSQPK